MENKEDIRKPHVQIPTDVNKEETSEITKFALGDELHKFNDDDEVIR